MPEQVADRANPEGVEPPTPAMLGRVVDHVATLAERGGIPGAVIAGIIVQVCAGEEDAGDAEQGRRIHLGKGELVARELVRVRDRANPPTPAVTPDGDVLVPPSSLPRRSTSRRWGRAQCSHLLSARRNRIRLDSSGQSIGYSQRCSGAIGMSRL